MPGSHADRLPRSSPPASLPVTRPPTLARTLPLPVSPSLSTHTLTVSGSLLLVVGYCRVALLTAFFIALVHLIVGLTLLGYSIQYVTHLREFPCLSFLHSEIAQVV